MVSNLLLKLERIAFVQGKLQLFCKSRAFTFSGTKYINIGRNQVLFKAESLLDGTKPLHF